MSSKLVRGRYVDGCRHAVYRPRLFAALHLWQGTINIQLPLNTEEFLILPNRKMNGLDQIDLDANQDFLVRPCRVKGIAGYQLLPVDKSTGNPQGHHSERIIEIALLEKIRLVRNEEIEVELEGFDG